MPPLLRRLSLGATVTVLAFGISSAIVLVASFAGGGQLGLDLASSKLLGEPGRYVVAVGLVGILTVVLGRRELVWWAPACLVAVYLLIAVLVIAVAGSLASSGRFLLDAIYLSVLGYILDGTALIAAAGATGAAIIEIRARKGTTSTLERRYGSHPTHL